MMGARRSLAAIAAVAGILAGMSLPGGARVVVADGQGAYEARQASGTKLATGGPSLATEMMQRLFRGAGRGGLPRSQLERAGFGWTNAHARRVARKARNVKRHRASCRGSRA